MQENIKIERSTTLPGLARLIKLSPITLNNHVIADVIKPIAVKTEDR